MDDDRWLGAGVAGATFGDGPRRRDVSLVVVTLYKFSATSLPKKHPSTPLHPFHRPESELKPDASRCDREPTDGERGPRGDDARIPRIFRWILLPVAAFRRS